MINRLFRLAFSVFCCALSLLCSADLAAQTRDLDSLQWQSNKGIIAVVGSPFIELYVQPGRGYARFHAVEKHERIRLYKSRTDWFKVETQDGKIGWVPRRDLDHVYDLDGYRLDFGTPSWSETQYPWQLGLLISDFSGVIAYTVYSGYRFTPNISAELRYTQAFGDFSTSKYTSGALLHQAFPQWRVSPFFALGAGRLNTYPDTVLVNAEDQKDNALTVGGGFMVYLTHKIMARVEYNHHTILTTRDNNEEVEEWKIGLSVQF